MFCLKKMFNQIKELGSADKLLVSFFGTACVAMTGVGFEHFCFGDL